MPNERIIRIFLASSDELKNERVELGDLVRQLQSIYKKYGIDIELLKWEDLDASYGNDRTQERYNVSVRASDMFIAIFSSKAGKWTVEEFEVALKHFTETSKPIIYIFMKKLTLEEEDITLKNFKEKYFDENEKYGRNYRHIEELMLTFVLQLQSQELTRHFVNLVVKNSEVMIDNLRIASLNNISFAANNKEFDRLNLEKEKLENQISKFRNRLIEEPQNKYTKDDLYDALHDLNEVCKELEQHELYLFDIAKTIAQQAGKRCSERMRKAMELFEQGKASEANGILNTEDINRDISINLNRWKQAKEQEKASRETLLLKIDELLMKTKTSMSAESLTMRDRLNQASEAFENAIELQRGIEVPLDELANTLFDYAYLLEDFNRFEDMLPLYNEALEIYQALTEKYPDTYLPDVATTLHNLAYLHSKLNKYEQAEKEYHEALEICKAFAEKHPDAYLPAVAVTLNNLAILHNTLNKYEQAEKEYHEALEICQALAEKHPDAYLRDVALTLNNLAYLHSNLNKYEQAEKEYNEALEIRRALTEKHPDTYLPDMALTLNDLAVLHSKLNKYEQAEKEYNEALEIKRALTEKHPDTYLPDMATTLNNMALLHSNLNKYDLAEKEYTEALEIRRALTEKHPDAYLPDMATTLNNMACLHVIVNKYDLAEKECNEALEIIRSLADKHSDAYLPKVAVALHNMAVLHKTLNKYDLAEKEYTEALEIRRVFYIKSPSAYSDPLCDSLFLFGDMLINQKIDEERGKQYIKEAHKIATDNNRQDYLDAINEKYGSFFE